MGAIVYSYDPRTSEYVGETIADENPEEPGSLLYPAFTTDDAPPDDIPPNMGAYWVGDEWELRSKEAPPLPPEEEVTPELLVQRAQGLAQALLDSTARSMGYDNILTAVTYADEPAVEKFQVEGRRLRRLRSLVWAECYSILEEVQDGAPWPSEDTFRARLPTYDEVVIMEQEGGT